MIRLALCISALAGQAMAHPHTYVDQQVQISVGLEQAELVIAIVPSVADGETIVDHLDANGDGRIDPFEANAFGAEVLATTRFYVDRAEIMPAMGAVDIADPAALAAGTGGIRIHASLVFDATEVGPHNISFAVNYDLFAPDWFVQPFYYPDIAAADHPMLERNQSGSEVMLSFTVDP